MIKALTPLLAHHKKFEVPETENITQRHISHCHICGSNIERSSTHQKMQKRSDTYGRSGHDPNTLANINRQTVTKEHQESKRKET